MHRGTPYVYQGEELGMTNTYFTAIEQYRDIESLNYHADALSLGMEVEAVLHSLSVKSRDNARTPMQWDDSSHAGFTEGIPVAAGQSQLPHHQRSGGRSRTRTRYSTTSAS